jgi:DNA-directed RNA polymerase sigma subunit (sigma70/sigma32)
MNYREIALEMNLTVATIRKIERRALQKLSRRPGIRELLEEFKTSHQIDTLWDAIRREADE